VAAARGRLPKSPRARRGGGSHVRVRGVPRVGRYDVAHEDLERLAIPALRAPADVVVLDELGKMELASPAFRDAVIALLERPIALVATVPAQPDPFTDELKRRPSVAVLYLTRANRDDLPNTIAQRLRNAPKRG
jgi:nucleoside-triphosphatase